MRFIVKFHSGFVIWQEIAFKTSHTKTMWSHDWRLQVWCITDTSNQFMPPTICSMSSTGSTHTHTHLTALFPGLPRWAGTRKVKPIWILLKQDTVSGNGISWAICKSAPRSRQITTPATHHSVFYRPDALPAAQPTVSKHWSSDSLTMSLHVSDEANSVLGDWPIPLSQQFLADQDLF